MSDDDQAGNDDDTGDATAATGSARRRPIRSFVLRQGRLTAAQQRAFEQHWERYGLEPCGQPLDLHATFGRDAERVLEIGFGNGEALRFAAANEPHRDFIGIEVHRPGVGHLLNALAADGLDNVRIYAADAVEVLHNAFAERSLDEIRVYFPDPWHKKRHRKRRLLQPAVARLLAERLKPGGLLHLATDWQDYAEQMWDVLDAEPLLLNPAGPRGSVPCPPWRPRTRFESRGLGLGHGVWDLLYRRC